MAYFRTVSSPVGPSFYLESDSRCSKPGRNNWRHCCAAFVLRSFAQKGADASSLPGCSRPVCRGLLSWVANFGYIGQHQAPLFLRTCIMALVLSATAIAGKVTRSPHTEKSRPRSPPSDQKLPTLPGPATSLACSVLLTVLSLVTALTWWGKCARRIIIRKRIPIVSTGPPASICRSSMTFEKSLAPKAIAAPMHPI